MHGKWHFKMFANELNSKFDLIPCVCVLFFSSSSVCMRLCHRNTVSFSYIPWASLSEILIYLTPKTWWCIAYDDFITTRKICISLMLTLFLVLSPSFSLGRSNYCQFGLILLLRFAILSVLKCISMQIFIKNFFHLLATICVGARLMCFWFELWIVGP